MLPQTRKMIAVGFGFVLCAVLLWSGAAVWAAGGDLDTTFNPGTGADDAVLTTAIQADGKIIIGGDFTDYNGTPRNYIARLNTDGSLDTSFDPGTGAEDVVRTTAVQADGKIIIGGDFDEYNGTGRRRIARLNTDGSLDLSFDPGTGADSIVWTTALQANGKIIIGGRFGGYNGIPRDHIARLNPNGSLDTAFDPGTGADDEVFSIAVQANGKIIIGGDFDNYNGTGRSRIAQLNTNGSLDTSFDPGTGADGDVLTTAVQADGKIIIVGDFDNYNGTSRNRIARINTNGSLDTSFNPGTGLDTSALTTTVQEDGKIIIGGPFITYNGTSRTRIARLNTDGSLDPTFNPGTGADNDVKTLAVQADGKIIIGGSFTSYNGTDRSKIARLLPAPGAISFSSATYNVNEGAGNATITLTRTGGTDNRVVAQVTLADVTTSPADYRFTPGALDTSFDPGTGPSFANGASGIVQTLAVQANGKIIIGGTFDEYNGTARVGIARLNSNGSLDASFDPGTGVTGGVSEVKTIALQADGKIIIGGSFDFYNGVARTNIARLNSDGSLDTSFDPGAGPNGSVLTIAVQADGRIIIGGQFPTYDGTSRNRIARLLNNGSLDTSFDPGTGADNFVNTTALQADGKIIIGGSFQNYNGTARNHIARVNIDGSLDTTFNPGTGSDSSVLTTAVQADGKIIIGGDFTSYNGTSRSRIARLNTNGSLDTSFDPGTGASSFVFTTAVQADGSIIIGGLFGAYNGTTRNGIARLDGDLFVTWLAGDGADKSITLPIVNDTQDEPDETLNLTITPLAGDATTGANPTSTLTIFDNDLPETSITAVSGAGVYNSTATLTAKLTSGVSPLSGKTITFKLNGNAVGMATTDANGVATLAGVDITGTSAGEYFGAVEARFAGDASYQGSSATGTLKITRAPTTTTVTSSLNPSIVGQSVTFTATVSSTAGIPSGTVQLKVDDVNSGSPVNLNASGVATFSTAALTVGTHTITANFSGPPPAFPDASTTPASKLSAGAGGSPSPEAVQADSNFKDSTGTLPGGQVVNKPATTTTVTSSVNPSDSGQSVTFTATVSSSAGTPTGTVQFKVDGASSGIAPAALDGSGVATFATSSLTAGTHTITADYSGDGNFAIGNGTLAGGQVVNNQPTLSINNRTVTEGSTGTTNAIFTVTLSAASALTVTANYATANGTATAPSDYAATSGTLTFNPGDTSKTVTVLVNGDTSNEPDETFTVALSGAGNTTITSAVGTGTITNDDTPSVQFQQALYSLTEDSTEVAAIVSRSGDTSLPITVDYQTSDVSALQRSDYIFAAGTLRFAAGETQKTINILINEDTLTEMTETLTVALSNPTGGAALGTQTSATVEITDDSDTGTGNSIDDAETFVRQHYHDFLNREGDAAGVAFWTSQITSCGANAACIDGQRQNVSGAFFLSIEFQQTGYFYIRLTKSAFGAQPEIPRYLAFLRDARQIGEGVVIGQPGSDLLLEANRQAFLREYVQRAEFVARYPLGQSSSLYVDAMFTNAGVTPTASERQAAITAYGTGDLDGRAGALRSVAESDSVYGAQYNPAFVLMQYFGYLRRNPDETPDTTFDGYNFWLGKLNSFSQPGENVRDEVVAINRVKRAEMIRAFLVSIEYRRRFGP